MLNDVVDAISCGIITHFDIVKIYRCGNQLQIWKGHKVDKWVIYRHVAFVTLASSLPPSLLVSIVDRHGVADDARFDLDNPSSISDMLKLLENHD